MWITREMSAKQIYDQINVLNKNQFTEEERNFSLIGRRVQTALKSFLIERMCVNLFYVLSTFSFQKLSTRLQESWN